MKTNFRIRCLGGSLLITKGLNDCVTIERNSMSKPCIVSIEGQWTKSELTKALSYWRGSEAQRR